MTAKCASALEQCGLDRLIVSGGVGANKRLREALGLAAKKRGFEVFYPRLEFCTDNGAMIAFAGAMRLKSATPGNHGFTVRPRWDLAELTAP